MTNKVPSSWEEMTQYMEGLESKPHDYQSIAEALSEATLTFFNYFAYKHGMTNWQTSWADLDFIQKVRRMEAGVMIIDPAKMLYPQYDLRKDLDKYLAESKPRLAKLAKERLDKESDRFLSDNVKRRWMELASYAKEEDK